MKLLRVLDLEGTSGLVCHHLLPIGKLLHLKYLSLRECEGIFHLPESLGNLEQLETLDVTGTRIIKLPLAITKLRKLQYILAGFSYNGIFGASSYEELMKYVPKLMRNKPCAWNFFLIMCCISICSIKLAKATPITTDMEDEEPINRRDVCTYYCCAMFPFLARLADPFGVAVPRGLRKLKALRTLGMVNIARGGKAILQEIKRLTRLRKLAVTGINKKNCQEFCSTLAHLSYLESLSVHSREEEGLRDCLDSLRTPPENLQSLKLYGTLGKLPEWVTGLQNLVKLKLERTELTELDGTMQVLDKLPNLAILRLLYHSFEAEAPRHLSCRREAFPSLTALETGWSAGIDSVLFEEGTAPKLELLHGWAGISLSGLSCLPSLKEVMIHKSSVDDVQPQLSRNPNKPVLKFV
jgi:Leucine-rich repeat (LRR) protein